METFHHHVEAHVEEDCDRRKYDNSRYALMMMMIPPLPSQCDFVILQYQRSQT